MSITGPINEITDPSFGGSGLLEVLAACSGANTYVSDLVNGGIPIVSSDLLLRLGDGSEVLVTDFSEQWSLATTETYVNAPERFRGFYNTLYASLSGGDWSREATSGYDTAPYYNDDSGSSGGYLYHNIDAGSIMHYLLSQSPHEVRNNQAVFVGGSGPTEEQPWNTTYNSLTLPELIVAFSGLRLLTIPGFSGLVTITVLIHANASTPEVGNYGSYGAWGYARVIFEIGNYIATGDITIPYTLCISASPQGTISPQLDEIQGETTAHLSATSGVDGSTPTDPDDTYLGDWSGGEYAAAMAAFLAPIDHCRSGQWLLPSGIHSGAELTGLLEWNSVVAPYTPDAYFYPQLHTDVAWYIRMGDDIVMPAVAVSGYLSGQL